MHNVSIKTKAHAVHIINTIVAAEFFQPVVKTLALTVFPMPLS